MVSSNLATEKKGSWVTVDQPEPKTPPWGKDQAGLKRTMSNSWKPPTLDCESKLLTAKVITALHKHIPRRLQLKDQWKLVYSTLRHGISLNTFYRHTAANNGPTILVIQDKAGHVFGGFASGVWKIKERFFGSGETFLFKLVPDLKIYTWTGKNEFFMLGKSDSIQMGGGL